METEVAVLSPEERLDLVDDIMRFGRIRHMPVVEDGRLIGIVSHRDLLAASLTKALDFDRGHRRTFMRSVEVKEVMTPAPHTVAPDATLAEVMAVMLRHQIGCVLVVNAKGVLVGLVTETDVLRAVLDEDREEEVEVGNEGSKLREKVSQEFDEVLRVRDELRVQMHLAKAEARDLWDVAEHKVRETEAKLDALGNEVEAPLRDVGDAARLLVDEIKDAYRRIREIL
jgi:CBS domain-containing protein